MKKQKHLFIMSSEVIKTADSAEIHPTLDGLKEMNLYRLPYERDVYIQIDAADIDPLNPLVQTRHLVYGPMDAEAPGAILVDSKSGHTINLTKDHPAGAKMYLLSFILRDILIVALATRNAKKVTTENKLAKLGIGNNYKTKFRYTTTISLPHELPDDEANPPTGSTKSPHLRRGHIRTQHYGAGNLLEKKIWIAPVFVNADPNFVRERQAYNVLGY